MGHAIRSSLLGHGAGIMLLLSCLAALLISPLPQTVAADNPSKALEQEIKAAMLYKFLGYVEWPETRFSQPSDPYRIWVLGAPHIEQELREITSSRTTNGRTIEIHKVHRVDQIHDAHMVFVGRPARNHLPTLSRQARRSHFLIVTENDEARPQGSTINLRMLDGRVGFDVSLSDAQEKQLKLSARLLSVATSVEREEH